MKKPIRYTDAPKDVQEAILQAAVITDLLPPPDQLLRAAVKVKITIALNQQTIDFFKRQATSNHSKYQTMINEVLDHYAAKHIELTTNSSVTSSS